MLAVTKLASKIFLSRQIFAATKIILVAAPANDIFQLGHYVYYSKKYHWKRFLNFLKEINVFNRI